LIWRKKVSFTGREEKKLGFLLRDILDIEVFSSLFSSDEYEIIVLSYFYENFDGLIQKNKSWKFLYMKDLFSKISSYDWRRLLLRTTREFDNLCKRRGFINSSLTAFSASIEFCLQREIRKND